MKGRLAALLLLLPLAPPYAHSANAAADEAVARSWLMMVTTQNTDPGREAEFNAWYDDVDIPDVLKVPGYMRARRGLEQPVPELGVHEGPLNYVALYDIESRAIDKTIIDMLMASWGMEKSHHSTDLLKVTERVYFHQYAPAYRAPSGASAQSPRYLYMTRIECCTDAASAKHFDRWYLQAYLPAAIASAHLLSATRYRLYRVLMDHPLEIPQLLIVQEIEAPSAQQAVREMHAALDRMADADPMKAAMAAARSSIFLEIADVPRPAP